MREHAEACRPPAAITPSLCLYSTNIKQRPTCALCGVSTMSLRRRGQMKQVPAVSVVTVCWGNRDSTDRIVRLVNDPVALKKRRKMIWIECESDWLAGVSLLRRHVWDKCSVGVWWGVHTETQPWKYAAGRYTQGMLFAYFSNVCKFHFQEKEQCSSL